MASTSAVVKGNGVRVSTSLVGSECNIPFRTFECSRASFLIPIRRRSCLSQALGTLEAVQRRYQMEFHLARALVNMHEQTCRSWLIGWRRLLGYALRGPEPVEVDITDIQFGFCSGGIWRTQTQNLTPNLNNVGRAGPKLHRASNGIERAFPFLDYTSPLSATSRPLFSSILSSCLTSPSLV